MCDQIEEDRYTSRKEGCCWHITHSLKYEIYFDLFGTIILMPIFDPFIMELAKSDSGVPLMDIDWSTK